MHHRVLRNVWTQSFRDGQQPWALPIPECRMSEQRLFPGWRARASIRTGPCRAGGRTQQPPAGLIVPLYNAQRMPGPGDQRIQARSSAVYHSPIGQTTSGQILARELEAPLRLNSISVLLPALGLPYMQSTISRPCNELRRICLSWPDLCVRLWDSTNRERTPPP
jgi:hypothetical protein